MTKIPNKEQFEIIRNFKEATNGSMVFNSLGGFRAEFGKPSKDEESSSDFLDPTKLSDNERRALLKQIETGEVLSISTYLTVFDESGNNQHHMGLAKGEMKKLARNCNGVSFLKDHQASTDNVVGIIEKGEVVDIENDGKVVNSELGIRVTFMEPDFMSRFVKGLIRHFSIGLGFGGLKCSVCNEEYEKEDFWIFSCLKPSCKHKYGQEYDGKTCKRLAYDASIDECSAVYCGAYQPNRIGYSIEQNFFKGDLEMAEKNNVVVDVSNEDELKFKKELEEKEKALIEKESAIAEYEAKIKEFEKKEFNSKLNNAIEKGKVSPRFKPFFEEIFEESGDSKKLDRFIELSEENMFKDFGGFIGNEGGELSNKNPVGLGVSKIYKEKSGK